MSLSLFALPKPWESNTCGECHWWRHIDNAAAAKMGFPIGGKRTGHCWKNPPQVTMIPIPMSNGKQGMSMNMSFPTLPEDHQAPGCFNLREDDKPDRSKLS